MNTAIRWAGACVIAFFLYRSVRVLSGAETHADIAVRFLGKLWVSRGIWGLFGGGGVAYGLKQRDLRRANIGRMGPRISQLEDRIDPQRSSSKLTERGETNPEDEL